ncbi:MAG: hypothetical protein VYA34_00080 [Myxococcota bacterium]|nr:hypothetical protein [Myxococcota bacterium]
MSVYRIAFVGILALFLAACGSGGDELACTTENNCVLKDGQAECLDGYIWASEANDDYRCIPEEKGACLPTSNDGNTTPTNTNNNTVNGNTNGNTTPNPNCSGNSSSGNSSSGNSSSGNSSSGNSSSGNSSSGNSSSGNDSSGNSSSGNSSSGNSSSGNSSSGNSSNASSTPVASSDGLPFLGGATHDLSNVEITVIADATDGLNGPTDVKTHPLRDELWITNQATSGTESMTMVSNANSFQPSARNQPITGGGQHFFAQPSAISFNQDDGTFASIHDSDIMTQIGEPTNPPFMGPTLWLSYGYIANNREGRPSNPNATFDAGHGSHLDMLHASPLGKGIAWEKDNIYWVFDGHNERIVRYNFNKDHAPGGTSHTDGQIVSFAMGQAKGVNKLPSHVVFDHTTNILYIANSGTGNIDKLDVNDMSFTPGGLSQMGFQSEFSYDTQQQGIIPGVDLETFVDGASVGMSRPSGLALHGGYLIVSDNQNGKIFAFDKSSGALLDYLEVASQIGDVMGLEVSGDALYVVDHTANKAFRLTAK